MNHIERRFDELQQQLREVLDDLRGVRVGFRSMRTLTLALCASIVAAVGRVGLDDGVPFD